MKQEPAFKPREIIFAPTGQCNLYCAHCRVKRGAAELDAASAIRFLDDCIRPGGGDSNGGEPGGPGFGFGGGSGALPSIERVGFSGGEPFLLPGFLVELCRAVTERGLLFDRLMTNGDWWADEDELSATLGALYEAGFDGILGLSYDAYHGQDPDRLAAFLGVYFRIWGRKDGAELLSVRSPDDEAFLRDLDRLAALLGGSVERSGGEPSRIVDRAYKARRAGDPDDGSGLCLPILRSPRSASADEGAWSAEAWFEDDYCEGPGQVLYVHPDGSVAVCCGFANERPELILGNIREGYAALMAAAAMAPHVGACYENGLGRLRQELEAKGVAFPGKTSDICFFCDYLCERGFAGEPPAPGA
jgi:MoaA/NifB/PqqE/SkfB family radical SAM enzyme